MTETDRAIEDVWLYPRPPAIEPVSLPVRIVFGGTVVASTHKAWRVLETSHAPVYYLPKDAFVDGTLEPLDDRSVCEWKGVARYWTIRTGNRRAECAAWSYAAPEPAYTAITDHFAVYAGKMDACFVGDEQVTPQPGNFYGGWITRNLKGPFKGGPGSLGW